MMRARLFSGYLLFALTIFLSAFLLFAIQPIASKHLLPYFGGSSSVWATSLLFFTAVLFVGYAYVYLVTTLGRTRQIFVHTSILAAAILATAISQIAWGSMYPPLDWIHGSTLAPAFRVLIALSLSIGIPYFLLSTTGPLLQFWYGSSSGNEPYKLYALSNAGSLLALLSYPFLIEPYIPLPTEESVWIVLFFGYTLMCAAIIYSLRNTTLSVRETAPITASRAQKAAWIGYAALPAFLLVAVTTVLTQLISPVPLLWIMPLALYLLTYIIAFSGMRRRLFMPLLVLIAATAAYLYTPASALEIAPQVAAYLSLLFFACLMCHAYLYDSRPDTSELPFFYLCTSLGGVLGTLAASIVAPFIFNDFWEFHIGLAITTALAGALLSIDFFPRIMSAQFVRGIRIVFPFVLLLLVVHTITDSISPSTLASRNFYGAVQIRFEEHATILQHGTTVHGLELTDTSWSYMPSTYYVQGSGIARALKYARDRAKGEPLRIGVVGLGTGSVAAYCEPDDTYVFYEIDPRIKDIATEYFHYLERCTGAQVRIGDGRLLLEAERTESGYDVLAVDAFTDDAIPAHLLTKEAVSLYIERLRSDQGIVAIHTSNRYLALAPMLLSITKELGLSTMIVNDDGSGGDYGSASQWALLSPSARVYDDIAFTGVSPWMSPEKLPASWTDNYTSLFSVLSIY